MAFRVVLGQTVTHATTGGYCKDEFLFQVGFSVWHFSGISQRLFSAVLLLSACAGNNCGYDTVIWIDEWQRPVLTDNC